MEGHVQEKASTAPEQNYGAGESRFQVTQLFSDRTRWLLGREDKPWSILQNCTMGPEALTFFDCDGHSVKTLELSPRTFKRVLWNRDNGKVLVQKSPDSTAEGSTCICLELANASQSQVFCFNMGLVSSPIAMRMVPATCLNKIFDKGQAFLEKLVTKDLSQREASEVSDLSPTSLSPDISKRPNPHTRWSKEEDGMLWDLVEKQCLVGEDKPTKFPLPAGTTCTQFFTLISTQLQQLGVSRSIWACQNRCYLLARRKAITKKPDAIPADVTPWLPSRPKRLPPGREDFIDSGTITFTHGEHRQRPSKKPRTMTTQKPANPQDSMSNIPSPSVTGNDTQNNNQITQNTVTEQIDRLGKEIQAFKITKENLTTKIGEYEALLETAHILPGLIHSSQLEVEGLEKKMTVKESAKKALITYLELLENSE